MNKKEKNIELWAGLNYSEFGVNMGEGKPSEFSYMGYPIRIFLTKVDEQLKVNIIIPDLPEAFDALNDKNSWRSDDPKDIKKPLNKDKK